MLDENYQVVSLSPESLRADVDLMSRTAATPGGVSGLLNTSRELYVGSWFHYEQFVVAATWSLLAVETAIRARLGVDTRPPFRRIIRRAFTEGLIDEAVMRHVDIGAQLRNGLLHPEFQSAWTPSMSRTTVGQSHLAISGLFPDNSGCAAEPSTSTAVQPGG